MTYEVFIDGSPVYSPGDPELAILNPVLELADSRSGSFEFDIPVTNPAYGAIRKMASKVEVRRDGSGIFYGRCVSVSRDFYNMKSVSCEGELAELMDTVQEPGEFHGYTVRQFLEHLINVHNSQAGEEKQFAVGEVTVRDPNDSVYRYTNWEDTLTCVNDKLLDRLGGHIRIRRSDGKRYIDYIEDYDHTNTQAIEFGENLLDYAENADASGIATRVIPLGKSLEEGSIEALEEYATIKSVNSGLPYLESEEAVKSFGTITKVIHFDDVEVPAILKRKGEEWLRDAQYENLCLTCTAADLSMAGGSAESIKLGDSVRVISPPHGMDRFFPVTALTIHLDGPEENTVTLGTDIKAGISERSAGDSRDLDRRIKDIPPLSKALASAKENASELINAATTGHVVTRPDEILIMDTDDKDTAAKVWRWNANGLGYSKTGYKGTYGLAMTIDGSIVADYITSGTLDAGLVKAGTLKDSGGNMSWDLKTGAITAKRLSISSANFSLDAAGNMSAKNASLSGTVTAEYGDNKAVMDSGRLYISYRGKDMGLIGANNMAGNIDDAGLSFDLNTEGNYMTWAAQAKEGGSYYMMWTYARDGSAAGSGGMLSAGCDIDMKNHALRNVSWPDGGGITGTCNFVRVTRMGDDGTVMEWSEGNKMQFKNGILVGGTFA